MALTMVNPRTRALRSACLRAAMSDIRRTDVENKPYIIAMRVVDAAMSGQVYRIELVVDSNNVVTLVKTRFFGFGKLDNSLAATYESLTDLPMWVQNKLSVLRLLDITDRQSAAVESLGARIGDNIYWLFEPFE